MKHDIIIPNIPEEEQTPTVRALLSIISQCVGIIHAQQEQIQQLKDEIARMKGGNPKPKIRPSALEKNFTRNGSPRKSKRRKQNKKPVEIQETIKVPPETVPKGSRFKGYKTYTVYDITIQAQTKRYRRERWRTPAGEWVIAALPPGITGHYGPELRQHVLQLYYEMNVPQHLILASITELGIPISTGALNNILNKGHDQFHQEKEHLLKTGMQLFPYLSVDDTGARHQGKNGYCTHIGNQFFSYFKSTSSKSRINFLKILRGKNSDYCLLDASFMYMGTQGLAESKYARLLGAKDKILATDAEWEAFLKMIGIRSEKEIKTVTEAALLGSILFHGINKDLVIVSDDAGQFNILLHALCWLHAERKLAVLVPINDYEASIIDEIRTDVWNFYNELKAYKQSPDKEKVQPFEEQFDAIFTQTTEFETINKALRLIYEIKQGLLMVLKRPEIPLHNNESENAIRSYVTKRKVQGGTRSDEGGECRDTFISLMKTCRKLDISFRDYLLDRLMGIKTIGSLEILMRTAFLERSPAG